MKVAFCLSIGPFWGKTFSGKNFGVFIIFGLRANFFTFAKQFLEGFQNCSLTNQFLAPCHKKFVRSVKIGFCVSKGSFWSKKNSFWKLFNFRNKLVHWTTRLFFLVKQFLRVVKAPLYVPVGTWREKNKNFFWKKIPSFLNLGWRIFGFLQAKIP